MSSATQIVATRMQSLQKLANSLKRLNLSWKVIETTARVVSPPESNGFIATLEHTRNAFSQLATEMVDQIALTHLTNCQHDLTSRAQVAIDILVRNLFERTADVGFIATDGPLVQFTQAPNAVLAEKLRYRLAEYRNKYTVYDDILILDASANLLLSLKNREESESDLPAWWPETLSKDGYTEHYGLSRMFRNAGKVLLYAHRILDPHGVACGAVVLKFDLPSELRSIFHALQQGGRTLVLLDETNCVVSSNDPTAFAPGETVYLPKPNHNLSPSMQHKGIDYLFALCETRGYQGYGGPGWKALSLVKLDDAFSAPTHTSNSHEAMSAKAGENIELEHSELQRIIAQARAIEVDLNRVIWNGKLNESGDSRNSALGPVFSEIGRTSKQTISAFDAAIGELKHLLLVGKQVELTSHASLAVDIMDRNLYERANDCRWWALSEELGDLLEAHDVAPSISTTQRASEILAHLNNLYTVYRRVALFDRHGRIVAVSRDQESLAQDSNIPTALVQRTFALKGTQAYSVSAMEPHGLADGEHTYLYCAPIRKVGQTDPLGGVALAFNCKDELQAMLKDSLPAGGETHAFLLDAQGRVLASSATHAAVGECPEFASALTLAAGTGSAYTQCSWRGKTYLTGIAKSKGYREFKTTDGYRDDVQSAMLTAVSTSAPVSAALVLPQPTADIANSFSYFGIVQCGSLMFALESKYVVTAISADNMSSAPAGSNSDGTLQFVLEGIHCILPVFDARKLTGQPPTVNAREAVAIVLRHGTRTIAILVDRLIDVVQSGTIHTPPGGVNPDSPWISGFIHDGQANTNAIFVLDPAGMPAFKTNTTSREDAGPLFEDKSKPESEEMTMDAAAS